MAVTAWIVVADVAARLGAPIDAQMTPSTDAANAWAYRTRPDLRDKQLAADAAQPPGTWVLPADVKQATVLFAARDWRLRTSPGGAAAYAEYSGDGSGDVESMSNIYLLIGSRKPVAR